VRLRIATTWDGIPILPAEAPQISLDRRAGFWHVAVEAPFFGDPRPLSPPGPTDRLWEHEVVELFVLGEDERYIEVELGPHGHHLVLELHGRRSVVRSCLPLDYRVARAEARWSGIARLPVEYLPPAPEALNAYAIHGVGTARRHLAWAPVPGDGPDFHRLEHFRRLVD
jgi:hypothetical protein